MHDARKLVEARPTLASRSFHGAEARRAVLARMERASEANRARMRAWIKTRRRHWRDAERCVNV